MYRCPALHHSFTFAGLRAKNAADRQQARGNRLQKPMRAGSCPQLFCAGARKFPLPQALMRLCALCSRCLLLARVSGLAGLRPARASACLGFRTGKMRPPSSSRLPCLPARMSRSNSQLAAVLVKVFAALRSRSLSPRQTRRTDSCRLWRVYFFPGSIAKGSSSKSGCQLHLPTSHANLSRVTSPANFSCQLVESYFTCQLLMPTCRELLHLPTSHVNFLRVTSPANFSCQLFGCYLILLKAQANLSGVTSLS